MQRNYAALNPAFTRAVEIANTGGHTMSVVYDPENPNPVLEQDIRDLKKAAKLPANTPFPQIIFEYTPNHPDEIIRFVTGELKGETFEEIGERIDDTLNFEIVVSDTLSSPCRSLLKMAIQKLPLSVSQAESCVSVAKTIALMAQCDTIKPEHIAEAIQYQSISYDHLKFGHL